MSKTVIEENLNTVLKKIIEKKIQSVEHKKQILPKEVIFSKIDKIDYVHRNFYDAIKRKINRISLIAECKKSTPTKGVLRKEYDVSKIVKEYTLTGLVDAISVLTEEHFFEGDIYHLIFARTTTQLPILRKDFIIDEYQIYESLYYNADAILLIASILPQEVLKKFYETAKSLSLEVVFEVHNEDELKKVLELSPQIIGINNRDLKSFVVSLKITEKLINLIPKNRNIVVISESGISSNNDVKYLSELGIDAILVGTYFMQAQDINQAVKNLYS